MRVIQEGRKYSRSSEGDHRGSIVGPLGVGSAGSLSVLLLAAVCTLIVADVLPDGLLPEPPRRRAPRRARARARRAAPRRRARDGRKGPEEILHGTSRVDQHELHRQALPGREGGQQDTQGAPRARACVCGSSGGACCGAHAHAPASPAQRSAPAGRAPRRCAHAAVPLPTKHAAHACGVRAMRPGRGRCGGARAAAPAPSLSRAAGITLEHVWGSWGTARQSKRRAARRPAQPLRASQLQRPTHSTQRT